MAFLYLKRKKKHGVKIWDRLNENLPSGGNYYLGVTPPWASLFYYFQYLITKRYEFFINTQCVFVYICMYISEVGDRNQGPTEGSLFK